MIRLTHDPIDYHALTEAVRRHDCGAVVTFLGTVREMTDGRQTVALDYEAYPGMAEKKMAEIEQETRSRWPVRRACRIPAAASRRPCSVRAVQLAWLRWLVGRLTS
jgi:molybdopterin synthase catalytic subunit